jgi:hypothetical protein
VLGLAFGQDIGHHGTFLMALISPSKQMPGKAPQLSHDNFLPYFLQIIILYTSSHSTPHSTATDGLIK